MNRLQKRLEVRQRISHERRVGKYATLGRKGVDLERKLGNANRAMEALNKAQPWTIMSSGVGAMAGITNPFRPITRVLIGVVPSLLAAANWLAYSLVSRKQNALREAQVRLRRERQQPREYGQAQKSK
ncbi:MAG TPA: hypothetical protein VJI67_01280 [archaeon]|nr:hypothetical protein [archaeon]HLD81152.1 hypothetical protein [archaeon]